jgi:hypothetical protein
MQALIKKTLSVQAMFSAFLVFGGVLSIFDGLLMSDVCITSGMIRLLLGVVPCLAGGYHAYCLASKDYVSHKERERQIFYCFSLYAASILMETALYQLLHQLLEC